MKNRAIRHLIGLLAIFLILALSAPQPIKAQDYSGGIGVRLGWHTGLTGKYFLSDKIAGEVIFNYRPGWGSPYSGFLIAGLGEYHVPLDDLAPGIAVFVGGGAHISFSRYRYYDCTGLGCSYRYNPYVGVGFDGIVGAEYHLEPEFDVPFTIGYDIKPYFEIPFTSISSFPFLFFDSAFSLRLTF